MYTQIGTNVTALSHVTHARLLDLRLLGLKWFPYAWWDLIKIYNSSAQVVPLFMCHVLRRRKHTDTSIIPISMRWIESVFGKMHHNLHHSGQNQVDMVLEYQKHTRYKFTPVLCVCVCVQRSSIAPFYRCTATWHTAATKHWQLETILSACLKLLRSHCRLQQILPIFITLAIFGNGQGVKPCGGDGAV